MKRKTKKLALLGVLSSVALICSYIEFLLPPISQAAPGIKIGLANIVIIFTLYRSGIKEACAVSLIRLLLSSLLFSGFSAFIYGLSGAVLSMAVMLILKKLSLFSSVGVSVGGGVFHNAGQIIAAVLILGTPRLGYYMLILALTGTAAGIVTGLAAAALLRLIPEKLTSF